MFPTILISLVVYFGMNAVIATFFQNVAALKGHGKEIHAFGVVLFLGIIGCIYVAALPDKIQQEQNQQLIELLRSEADNEKM